MLSGYGDVILYSYKVYMLKLQLYYINRRLGTEALHSSFASSYFQSRDNYNIAALNKIKKSRNDLVYDDSSECSK